jgi:hypothetical protein
LRGFLENGVGGCFKAKGAAVAVVVLDKLVDSSDQIAHAAATDDPLGNQSEPAFHLTSQEEYVGVKGMWYRGLVANQTRALVS